MAASARTWVLPASMLLGAFAWSFVARLNRRARPWGEAPPWGERGRRA